MQSKDDIEPKLPEILSEFEKVLLDKYGISAKVIEFTIESPNSEPTKEAEEKALFTQPCLVYDCRYITPTIKRCGMYNC